VKVVSHSAAPASGAPSRRPRPGAEPGRCAVGSHHEGASARPGRPGTLTDDLAVPEVYDAPPGQSLAELAAEYKLRRARRPSVFAYAGQLWARRHFIMGFATARNIAMYTEARLGQLWQVLTPLLNAAVYYLIFGIILDTSRGVRTSWPSSSPASSSSTSPSGRSSPRPGSSWTACR